MNFLKNIAEKAKSVTDSPTKSGQNGSSPQEGFICPLCLQGFDAPSDLQNHFEEQHSEESDIAGPPSPRFGSLGLRAEDGRAETPQSDEEKSLFSNQVRALEESKTLLANEVMSLRKQLAQKQTESVPSERILERANELAAENVGLKAAIDETTGEKKAMEDRINILEEQLENRASRDDSALLRQELVNIQKTMDDSLKEKERELKNLKGTYDELFYEKQQLVDTKEKQDKSLIEAQHKLREAAEQQSNGSATKEDLEIVDILKSEINILKKEVDDLKIEKEESDSESKAKTNRISELTDEVGNKTDLVTQLSEDAKTAKLQVDELEKRVSKINEELCAKVEEIDKRQRETIAAQSEKNDLEMLLQTVQAKSEQLQSEKEAYKLDVIKKTTEVENHQREIGEKENETMRLQEALESKEADILRLFHEKEELLTKIEAGEGINTAIDQLKTENTILQDKLENEKKQFSIKEAEKSAMIDSLNLQIGTQKVDLAQQKELNEKVAKEKENQVKSIQDKLIEKDELLKQTKHKADSDNEKNKEKMLKMEETLNSTTGTLKGMKLEYDKLQSAASKSKHDIQQKENHLKEMTSKIETVEKKANSLEQTVKSLKEDLLEEKNTTEKMRSELKENNTKSIAFETKVKTLEDQSALDKDNIKTLKQAKTLLQDDVLRLETLLEEKTTELENTNQKVDSKEARINQLTNGLTDTEIKVKEMQRVLDEASGKELSLLSDIEQKRKEICEIQEEKASVVIHLESQQTILQRLTDEKDAAEKELRMSKSETQSLEEKVCQLQSTIEKNDKSTKEDIHELKTARELLLSQVVDLKNEKENVSAKIEEDELKHRQAIKDLEKKLDESKLTIASLEKDLQREKAERASDIKTAQNSYFSLEGKYNSVQVQVESLASEVFTLTSNLSGVESERDTALSKSLELEAALGSATEERRGLLERCVSSEAETERTRGITLELRRKLDDAQAALHELGRENQSIQMELSKQSGRKWKDDTDVASCSGCQSGFSLTNRKHHCRNCGNIFCNECSNKQANMAGYKKPQRVCDGCYSELGSK